MSLSFMLLELKRAYLLKDSARSSHGHIIPKSIAQSGCEWMQRCDTSLAGSRTCDMNESVRSSYNLYDVSEEGDDARESSRYGS